jgi:hypothetical protein
MNLIHNQIYITHDPKTTKMQILAYSKLHHSYYTRHQIVALFSPVDNNPLKLTVRLSSIYKSMRKFIPQNSENANI